MSKKFLNLNSRYALCGFANFGTIGVQIAVLTLFAPNRSHFITKNVTKAMFAGNLSSFMNACIAGLLFKKIS
jgi:nucleoside permease NupC